MKKISNVSRILKWVCIITCMMLPIIEAGWWMTNGLEFLKPHFDFGTLVQFNNEYPITWDNITHFQRFTGFLVNMLPIGFSMGVLIYLAMLFSSFERLELFSSSNAHHAKRAGSLLICGQLIHPIYTALLSLVLTQNNPVGERILSISLSLDQFEIIAIGLAICVVSWILEQAAKMHEEHQGTI